MSGKSKGSKKRSPKRPRRPGLPAVLRGLFWDCDVRKVSWAGNREFVISRVLSHGGWNALRWLRRQVADDELREFILRRRGRELGPEQLRYWEIVLGLPHDVVTRWLESPARRIWDRRGER